MAADSLEKSIPELLSIPVNFVNRLLLSTQRLSQAHTETSRQDSFNIVFPSRIIVAPFDRLLDSLPWRVEGLWRSPDAQSLGIGGIHSLLMLQQGVTIADLRELHSFYSIGAETRMLWR
jgi:hypothetical protein